MKLPGWVSRLLSRSKPPRGEPAKHIAAPKAVSSDSAPCWPTLIAHVATEDPWSHDPVVVAEFRSFDERPYAGQRHSFCALVPMDELEYVAQHMTEFSDMIETSGPHPSPHPGMRYEPTFSIEAHGDLDDSYEPLVLSWKSHDKRILIADPGFLMTYGLVPRNRGDGGQIWDNPAGPEYDIVQVGPPSTWKFPLASPSTVTVRRAYLQDYLSLRNMALVQVYYERRCGESDAAIDKVLGDQQAVELEGPDHQITIHRLMGRGSEISVDVSGARVIARAGPFPVSDDPLEITGLAWPGITGLVTRDIAARLRMENCVYVDDRVLANYEGKEHFRVNPMNGAVEFGTQWSVGFCARVGRDLIRLELKKLYEGTPTHVVRHWQRFAVPPLPSSAYPAALEVRHVGRRAQELVYAFVVLGEALSQLDHALGGRLESTDFVGLDRDALDYRGWSNFESTQQLGWHIPLDMTMSAFLDRCGMLDQFLVEGLKEGCLRKLLMTLGVNEGALQNKEGKPLRGLKLLDRLVCLAQVSAKTGLSLPKQGRACWEILEKEGTTPPEPVGHLFALHDIRGLDAHRVGDRKAELYEEFERFGVKPGEEAAGYGLIADRVYDILIDELSRISALLSAGADMRA